MGREQTGANEGGFVPGPALMVLVVAAAITLATLTVCDWVEPPGDAGPGWDWRYGAASLGGLVAAEGIVWLLHAFAYRRFAGLTWRRAWQTSLAANAESFLSGQVAAVGLAALILSAPKAGGPPQLPWLGLAVVLAVSAGLTLAAGLPMVWAMNRDHPRKLRLLGVAAVANLVGLPVLWAMLWPLLYCALSLWAGA